MATTVSAIACVASRVAISPSAQAQQAQGCDITPLDVARNAPASAATQPAIAVK